MQWTKEASDAWDAKYNKRKAQLPRVENLIERVDEAVQANKFHSNVHLAAGEIDIKTSGPKNSVAYTSRRVLSKDFANWNAEDFMAFEAYAIKELSR